MAAFSLVSIFCSRIPLRFHNPPNHCLLISSLSWSSLMLELLKSSSPFCFEMESCYIALAGLEVSMYSRLAPETPLLLIVGVTSVSLKSV